jgi:hypothetical protein
MRLASGVRKKHDQPLCKTLPLPLPNTPTLSHSPIPYEEGAELDMQTLQEISA